MDHILLLDDDEIFTTTMATVLRHAGFDVATANTFTQALELLESSAPIDLMLTDIVMQVNGIAMARMARLRRVGLPVIYLTGYNVPNVLMDDPVLSKPVTDETLIRTIRDVLTRGDHPGRCRDARYRCRRPGERDHRQLV